MPNNKKEVSLSIQWDDEQGRWFVEHYPDPHGCEGELLGVGDTKGKALRDAAANLDVWNDEVPKPTTGVGGYEEARRIALKKMEDV